MYEDDEPQVFKDYQPYYGQYKPVFHCMKGDPFFTLGPGYLWSLALMIVLNLITLPILIIMQHRGHPYRPYRLVQLVTLMIVDICYIGTAFINPGIVVVAPTRQQQTSQFCEKCRLWKSEGQKHCDVCQICIRDGVHHCPLLGTHIGKYNHIAFFFYVLAMFMWCINVFVSIAVLVSK